MAAEMKEEVYESSDEEADNFDNYGVFKSDYEFKFVQEGNDKTTLLLPPVTYDSMEVKYFNVEIEVDSKLLVSAIEKEKTADGTSRYFFRIAKPAAQLGQGDGEEVYEEMGDDGYNYELMKDKAEVKSKTPKGKNPKARAPMDAHNYSKQKVMVKSAPTIKVESEEEPMLNLDGTQFDKGNDDNDEEEEEEDEGEDMEDDGDDDDDMDDLEEIEMGGNIDDDDDYDQNNSMKTPKRKKPKQEATSSGKKRKYDKTSYYSKQSANFTVEMTDGGQRYFKCQFCDYKSLIPGNMKLHVRQHTGERPFTCPICSATFARQSTLKSHTETVHVEERKEVCEYCNASFKTKKNLQTHMRRHLGIKKHLCPICGKKMANKFAMEMHVNTHTKAHKFMCGICGKCVSSDSAMKRHMLLHTGGKYECHLCSKTFVRKEEWRKHMIKEHNYTGNEDILEKRYNQVQEVKLGLELKSNH